MVSASRRAWRVAWKWIVLPALLAVPVSLLMTYLALEHNAKEAYCTPVATAAAANYSVLGKPCHIRWDKAGSVFVVWFACQWLVFNVIHLLWFSRPDTD